MLRVRPIPRPKFTGTRTRIEEGKLPDHTATMKTELSVLSAVIMCDLITCDTICTPRRHNLMIFLLNKWQTQILYMTRTHSTITQTHKPSGKGNQNVISTHAYTGSNHRQVAQLSQRDHAAGCVSFGQKVEDWNWETIFTTL